MRGLPGVGGHGPTPPGWRLHPALQPVAFQAALFTGEGVAAPRKIG